MIEIILDVEECRLLRVKTEATFRLQVIFSNVNYSLEFEIYKPRLEYNGEECENEERYDVIKTFLQLKKFKKLNCDIEIDIGSKIKLLIEKRKNYKNEEYNELLIINDKTRVRCELNKLEYENVKEVLLGFYNQIEEYIEESEYKFDYEEEYLEAKEKVERVRDKKLRDKLLNMDDNIREIEIKKIIEYCIQNDKRQILLYLEKYNFITKKIVEDQDENGDTLLIKAIRWDNNYVIVKILLNYSANINIINNKGKDILDYALDQRDIGLYKYIKLMNKE
jgi:hypothetical protein